MSCVWKSDSGPPSRRVVHNTAVPVRQSRRQRIQALEVPCGRKEEAEILMRRQPDQLSVGAHGDPVGAGVESEIVGQLEDLFLDPVTDTERVAAAPEVASVGVHEHQRKVGQCGTSAGTKTGRAAGRWRDAGSASSPTPAG